MSTNKLQVFTDEDGILWYGSPDNDEVDNVNLTIAEAELNKTLRHYGQPAYTALKSAINDGRIHGRETMLTDIHYEDTDEIVGRCGCIFAQLRPVEYAHKFPEDADLAAEDPYHVAYLASFSHIRNVVARVPGDPVYRVLQLEELILDVRPGDTVANCKPLAIVNGWLDQWKEENQNVGS